jgi:hypothetical protein
LSVRVIADVAGQVYAYRDGALLVVVRGRKASPFGPAFGRVRQEMDGRCTTLGYRGENVFKLGRDPDRTRNGEVTVYKVWGGCPRYEHDCARVGTYDAG